jgi:hypothetical protein
LLVTAENPSGTPAFRDIATDPPTSEAEFVGLWKAYFLSLIAGILRDYGVETDEARRVYRYLTDAGLLKPKASLASVLRAVRDFVKQARDLEGGFSFDPNTGMPTGITAKITLKEPERSLRDAGFVSIDELLDDANTALRQLDFSIWLLLDRLDVAFVQHEQLEKSALRALFKAYLDIKNLDKIALKIFLRSDIWDRITEEGFREASHITSSITITWNRPSLLQLTMRRILRNRAIADYLGVEPTEVFSDVTAQEGLLTRLFPDQIDAGRNPKTFDWMLSRTKDGSGETAPRELIHLLSSSRESQLRRTEIGHPEPPDEILIDRPAFKDALQVVSEVRLKQTLYAEYPEWRTRLEALDGAKAQQSPATLAEIWGVNEGEAESIADRLVELGFFERRGTRSDPDYWVPFLYRDALHLVQGEARVTGS